MNDESAFHPESTYHVLTLQGIMIGAHVLILITMGDDFIRLNKKLKITLQRIAGNFHN